MTARSAPARWPKRPRGARRVAVALAACASLVGTAARADQGDVGELGAPDDAAAWEARVRLRELARPGRYAQLLFATSFGEGVRGNNPFRLARELGADGQSLSLTAPYVDVAVGATTGPPDGLQHGAYLALSSALGGTPQQVLTPSYLALARVAPRWIAFGRAGLPIVLTPDANVGGELALGGVWLVSAGIGPVLSIVADGFYGAATREVRATFVPVVSAQLGLLFDYEVLP